MNVSFSVNDGVRPRVSSLVFTCGHCSCRLSDCLVFTLILSLYPCSIPLRKSPIQASLSGTVHPYTSYALQIHEWQLALPVILGKIQGQEQQGHRVSAKTGSDVFTETTSAHPSVRRYGDNPNGMCYRCLLS